MANASLVNFAAGETSPLSRGRFDAPWYPASCQKLQNFIPEVAGPARYRPGFPIKAQTAAGAEARLVPFVLNSSRSFMLEFTALKMRVYKDEELLQIERTTLTAVSQATQAVITVSSTTGLANGDEVIITGLVGMLELNGRQVLLSDNSGSTFKIKDPVTGSYINSTGYGAYVSGGTLREVYEIATPYLAADLDNLQWAPDGNTATAYITCVGYAPRKLTVDSADVFTLSTYSRTNDPFAAGSALNLTGVSLTGSYIIISFALGTVIDEDAIYTFAAVGGTTELNGNSYRMAPVGGYSTGSPTAVNVYLYSTTTGARVTVSGFSAWTAGGTATPAAETPIGVAFYESRLFFIGTNRRPNTIFGSKAPDSNGNPQYDVFTGGTSADNAVFFALAPASGQSDYLTWGRGTSKFLFAGSYGGPFRISGSGVDEPITPSSINVRQIDLTGCEAVVPAGGSRIFFIQRGGSAVRSLRYSADLEDYESYNMMLNSEHIASVSPLRRVVLQTGRPNILWVVREDGVLAGMTVEGSENVAGWHRQVIGGTDAKILDVQVLPRTDENDQLWLVTERTINGTTRRFVEVWADDVVFPDKEDFYGQGADEDADRSLFENAVYRRQEECIHLDGAGTYDGSDRGTDAGATITLSSLAVGTGRTITASAAVFASTDVGREIWVKPDRDTGVGAGRATITAYTDPTHVTATVTVAFSSTGAHAAGDWYFTATTIYGLWNLEGENVAVVTDGAVYSDGRGDVGTAVTVASGKITLTEAAAVVHVGLPYDGVLKTQNLEVGGQNGPVQSKPRNIFEFAISFLNTLGVQYGTDFYNTETIEHRRNDAFADRPAPVFSGIRKLPYADRWRGTDNEEEEKHIVITQLLPLPATIRFIDARYEVGDL